MCVGVHTHTHGHPQTFSFYLWGTYRHTFVFRQPCACHVLSAFGQRFIVPWSHCHFTLHWPPSNYSIYSLLEKGEGWSTIQLVRWFQHVFSFLHRSLSIIQFLILLVCRYCTTSTVHRSLYNLSSFKDTEACWKLHFSGLIYFWGHGQESLLLWSHVDTDLVIKFTSYTYGGNFFL